MRQTILLIALCLVALFLAACGRLDMAIVEPTPDSGGGVIVPVSDAGASRKPDQQSSPTPKPTDMPSAAETPEPITPPAVVQVEETLVVDQPSPADVTGEASPENDPPPPQITTCTVRLDWPLYIVEGGDTLFNIAREASTTVNDLVVANCLGDPDRLYSGQQLRLPQLPPDPPEPTATAQPEPWQRFHDDLYQVSFEYPAAWRDTSSELVTRLTGEDGWLQVAGAGTSADLDSFATDQAYHKLQPYGSEPAIERMILADGRQARLILPSANQPSSLRQQAMIITLYADPIFIGDHSVNYLMLAADVGHIRDIGATLTMPPPANDIFIDHFSVSGEELPAGGRRLTFRWRAGGATRGTITSGTNQRFPPRWPVESAGELIVDVDGTIFPDPVMTLRLVNDVTGQIATATAMLSWACEHDYFFQPPPETCARDAVLQVEGAYQPFERGFMIWLPQPDAPLPSIFVFINNGQASLFPDTWSAGDLANSLGESSPEGLVEPVGGFAKVWREHPSVRESLGWATAEERLYTVSYQAEARDSLPGVTYLTRPDGAIVRFLDSNWQLYVPGQDIPGSGGDVAP